MTTEPANTSGTDQFNVGPTISNQSKLMACRYCGHLNPRTARFCSKCGARFGFASYAEAYAMPAVRRLGWLVLLAIPAGLACLGAFIFIASGLGFGSAVRSLVNLVFFGLACVGLVVLGLGVLYFTYKRKRN